jgi:hypothetical protein
MNVVVLIRSNPMESGRATEGIRVALGLASGGHRVELFLIDGATRLLEPDAEEAIDGEMGQKFLATLREWIPHFVVEAANAGDLSKGENNLCPLSREEIASRIAAADRFILF